VPRFCAALREVGAEAHILTVRDRAQIREVVWQAGSAFDERVDRVIGALFRWLDHIIVRSLNALEVRKLVLAVLPAFALLQPIGNLLEMLVSVVAAVVAACALGTFLEMRKVVRPRPQISASSIIR
jgi:hypothetical protein